MADVGIGFRTVNSLAIEISLHFLQPHVNTTLTQLVTVPGIQTVTIGSVNAIYPGALLVIAEGVATVEEIITVLAVDPVAGTITANFAITHNTGTPIVAATFPVQQITDPLFTQSEVLGYIARAQNEFLTRVPCIFQLVNQSVAFGQILQATPCQTVEINRVASSAANIALASLTRTSNVVTAVSASPHGLIPGSKFSIIASADVSFLGAFQVATIIDFTTFTYPQAQPDGASASATAGLWVRLYERSQEELTMQDRSWMNQSQPLLHSWFEDRVGIYQWGVGGRPMSNFPVELLLSVRDSDILALTDGFLVPDLLIHFVKYRAMQFMWEKDGEQRNEKLARYCSMRFERGILASQRWLDGVQSAAPQSATGGRRSR